MFCIQINYTTGNSFRSWETEETLDYGWKNLDIVKENIKRLAEHYDLNHREIHGYGDKLISHVDKMKLIKKSRWCVKPTEKEKLRDNDDWVYEGSLMLLTDNNEEFRCSASSWCGYFEHVSSIEVITNFKEANIYF